MMESAPRPPVGTASAAAASTALAVVPLLAGCREKGTTGTDMPPVHVPIAYDSIHGAYLGL